MTQLGSYINSTYLSAANRLNGKKARKVIAYVESYDDIFFWRSILAQLETPGLKFQIMLPTRGRHLGRGKKAALMAAFADQVGPHMIACVDADYDYLKQGTDTMSQMVCNNKYVFHTYAYAIENLQCWAPALREICVMATLNDHPDIMDFQAFLHSYSQIIYPLFLWNILSARRPDLCRFPMPDMMTLIKTGIVTKQRADEILRKLKSRVDTRLHQLTRAATPSARHAYQQLDKEITTLGITPQDTYLYIQGHHLFDDLVVPMLIKECDLLISDRENEIRTQSKHTTQSQNEISSYEHSLETVTTMLRKSTLYLHSPQVQKILQRLQTFIHETNTDNTNQ